MMELGSLRILNAGAGDLRITFGPDDTPEERERAAKMIRDMLRRGYALLVEDADGAYVRAVGYDPEASAYIVAGLPSVQGVEDGQVEAKTTGESATTPAGKKKRGRPRRAIAASGSRAVAVARSAGG